MKALSPRRIGLPWPEPSLPWMQILSFDHSCHNLPLTPSNERDWNRQKQGSSLAEVKPHCVRKPKGRRAADGGNEVSTFSQSRAGALWEAGQSNWLEGAVIFVPVDEWQRKGKVRHCLQKPSLHGFSVANRRNSFCPKNLPVSFKKMHSEHWNERKVN